MLRRTVTAEDAVVAVWLWDATQGTTTAPPPPPLYSVFTEGATHPQQQAAQAATLHANFPVEPALHYRQMGSFDYF